MTIRFKSQVMLTSFSAETISACFFVNGNCIMVLIRNSKASSSNMKTLILMEKKSIVRFHDAYEQYMQQYKGTSF